MNSRDNFVLMLAGGLNMLLVLTPFISQAAVLPGEQFPVLDAVATAVTIRESSAAFIYEYAINNPMSNTGKIERIEIDIARGTAQVSMGGLNVLTNDSSFLEGAQDVFSRDSDHFVPVGFRSPVGWISGYSIGRTASWGATDPANDGSLLIPPGSRLSGFALHSRGLPAARQIVFWPEFVQTPVEDPNEEDLRRVRAISGQIQFRTMTIGPAAPVSFDPSDLIVRLISEKHKAAALGWLGGPKLVDKLDQRLDQAAAALASGKNCVAHVRLAQFVRRLSSAHDHPSQAAGNTRFASDEAAQLLGINADVILARVAKTSRSPEEERDCRNAEKDPDEVYD